MILRCTRYIIKENQLLLEHWKTKYMTAILKNVYFDVLHDIVNKYKNTVHRTIKMKPIYVKENTYADSKKEVNDKDPKFKVRDHVRISTYKNIFAKG